MIRYIFMVLITILFTLSCNNPKEVKEYYENGKIKSILTIGKDRVKKTTYHKNGQIESEGNMLNGIHIGNWKYYNENKKLQAQGYYEDGLKQGPWDYNIHDSTYQIEWDIFYNRQLKINLPSNWMKKEQLAENVPLAAYSTDSGWDANFNIIILSYDHKPIDSIINENIRKVRVNQGYNIEILSIKEVNVNNINGKEVVQHVLAEGKDLIGLQYDLIHSDSLYIISAFINKNKYPSYENLIKEIVYSFTLR